MHQCPLSNLISTLIRRRAQCVPAHSLRERTLVLTRAEVRRGHAARLAGCRHLRYLWVPYADAVVVVEALPAAPAWSPVRWVYAIADYAARGGAAATAGSRFEPMAALLSKLGGASAGGAGSGTIAGLRDALLAAGPGPLSAAHVREVNLAEAKVWRRSGGVRTARSDEVLGFDCGGQQVLRLRFSIHPSIYL